MAVSAESFRELFGSFAAPVGVVTALDAAGRPCGFTCTAWTAVSLEPALLQVCVDRDSRTLAALAHSRAFVLHVLDGDGEATARELAGPSSRKFTGLRWQPSAAAEGAPVLSEHVLAMAACTVQSRVPAGDHVIVIGSVRSAEARDGTALYYRRGRYSAWPAPDASFTVSGL
jgi:flavin reductase (DIM6/NTAB) family NADH-FMN oxidoreductase RutF